MGFGGGVVGVVVVVVAVVAVVGGSAVVLAGRGWLLGRHACCRSPFGGACVAAFACVVALEREGYLGEWWVGCHSMWSH